ncbi:sulfatase-like hydrolase/transferase [Ideonella paludis]|uniref:sulfatase-like hydrolase/transferase n=1 Tax=Ideonella paludis TaxID=1233411 RepID=UPI0036453420
MNAQPPAAQDVLALARAAGYEVHWISNHDDLAIQQRHGALAQEQAYPNHTPGRASKSLDEVVLPYVEQALARGAKHKLVVVHLLGAHPHYSARFPESFEKFGDNDAVAQQMREQGRWPWIRHLRHDYDTSLRYHDQVLSRLLTLTQAQASKGPATWIMVSDHGQEVGHQRNHTGHSPSTPAGYRIPLVVWRDRGLWPEAITQQPVRGLAGHDLGLSVGFGVERVRSVPRCHPPLYQWQPRRLQRRSPIFDIDPFFRLIHLARP